MTTNIPSLLAEKMPSQTMRILSVFFFAFMLSNNRNNNSAKMSKQRCLDVLRRRSNILCQLEMSL